MQRLRYPGIALAAVVVVLIAVYLAWISPESSKLASTNSTVANLTTREQTLRATVIQLEHLPHTRTNCTRLTTQSLQIPSSPDQNVFITDLQTFANTSGIPTGQVQFSFPAQTALPAAKGTTSPLVPIAFTVTVTGTYDQLLKFIRLVGTFPRLMVVTSYTLKTSTQAGSSGSSGFYGSSAGSLTVPPAGSSFEVDLGGNLYWDPTEKTPTNDSGLKKDCTSGG